MARTPSSAAHQSLLDATLEILLIDGVTAVTVDEVVRRSGVAKTTLYRHFGSSDALIFAAVQSSVSTSDAPDSGTLRGDLEAIQRQYLATAAAPQARELLAWMVSKGQESPEYSELFRRVRVQPRGPTVVALQRAIARGEISPETDIGLAMHVIQGPLISQRLVDNRDVTPDELDRLLDMILLALGATPK